MTFRHPLSFPLGIEGMALLRAYAGDDKLDQDFTEDRITEIRRLLDAYDKGELGAGDTIGAVDAVTGYRDWSARYDQESNPLIVVEEPIVLPILTSLPAGRALDAACGTGRYSAHLAAHGHDVIGTDISTDMLAKARAKVPAGQFAVADLTALPVPDDHIDLVVCALALPHVPDLVPVLAEFARVLRPGGHLVLSDIHWQSLYLGGIAAATDENGVHGRMPASRHRPSDYLAAALPLGFQVRAFAEPCWPRSPMQGGPWLRQWAADAADAAYENTPAAIIWHLQLPSAA
jgi:SAM-dependent methyltransferase